MLVWVASNWGFDAILTYFLSQKRLVFFVAFRQRVFYLARPVIASAAFAAEMVLETSLVSFTTILLASYIYKQPNIRVDLTNVWHLLSFAIGSCWAFVTALIRLRIIRAYSTQSWPTFGDSWLNILDIGTIALVAPFVISFVNQPVTWKTIRIHPRLAIIYILDIVLICILPYLSHVILSGYTLFPFMAGLYLSFPLINMLAPWVGAVGITFSVMLCGISAGATAVGRWNRFTPEQQSTAQYNLREQMLWIQLFLYIMAFSSLAFLSVLVDRDRARESVEEEVRIRTEELRKALEQVDREKEFAEEASKAKGAFLGFLAHELRVDEKFGGGVLKGCKKEG